MRESIGISLSIGVGIAVASGTYHINNRHNISIVIPYNNVSNPSVTNKINAYAVNEIIKTCKKKCVEIKNNNDGSYTLSVVPQ